MMMMVVASFVSFVGQAFNGGHDILVVVVMRVSLEPLDPTQRCGSPVAFLIAPSLFLFRFSTLVSCAVVTGGFGVITRLLQWVIDLLTSTHATARER